MDESVINQLVFSILQFFDDQQRSPNLSPAAIESLEVASQCLESAYGISIRDVEAAAMLRLPSSLPEIFAAGLMQLRVPEASVADKELSEKLKSEGNEFMKQEKYNEAVDCYTRAISLDGRNAVYYCNRAAAYGKTGEHEKSILDCRKALELDPRYCKAYARKGLAHTALGQQAEAHTCFKKALEIDPVNEGYRDNLLHSEQSLHDDSANSATRGMGELGLGGLDFSSVLNNPALMNMATSMLSNPQMQTMMANMMAGATGPSLGPTSMSSLLQVGQQLAQQMQQSNPELVEQLRSQMRTQSTSSSQPGSPTPPNPDESQGGC